MDDKALISNLLVQGSDRVQLVVFKEARAEIWKIFRLVYLDNKPMPYAVCVKCLKPVAYCKKTTGSLHKHPCANSVTKFWSKSLKRKKKGEEEKNNNNNNNNNYQNQRYDGYHDQNGQMDYNRNDNVSLSNIQQAALYNTNNISLFGMNKSQQNLDALNNQNVSGNILVRFTNDIGNGQTANQPSNKDKNDQIVRLCEMVCQNLLDLDERTFDLLYNNVLFKQQNGSFVMSKLDFDEIKSYLKKQFNKTKQEIRKRVLTLNSLNLIVDFWSNHVLNSKFITVWAAIGNDLQILSTRNITYIEDYKELVRIIDEVRCDFIQSNKPYLYLFDNEIPDYCFTVNHLYNRDRVVTCLKHQLHRVLHGLFDDSSPLIVLVKNVFKLTPDVLERYHHYTHSYNLIIILKRLFEEYDDFEAQLLKKGFLIREIMTKIELEEILHVLTPLLLTFEAIGKNISDLYIYFNLFKSRLDINEHDREFIKLLKTKLRQGITDQHLSEHLFLCRLYLEPKMKNSKELQFINFDKVKMTVNEMIEIRKQLAKSLPPASSAQALSYVKDNGEEMNGQMKINSFDDELISYDMAETNQLFFDFWHCNQHNLPNLSAAAFQLEICNQSHKCCQLNDYGRHLSFRRLKLSKNDNINEILFLNSHLNFSTKYE